MSPNMDSFENFVEQCRHERSSKALPLPRFAVGATSRDSTLNYMKSFGDNHEASDIDAVYRIASCTKFLTSVAAMQCVEKGLLELDEDVSSILPELKHPKILTEFDGSGQPIFQSAKNVVTLRRLLTHTSGMIYPWAHPPLQRYQDSRGIKPEPLVKGTLDESFPPVLAFEPGEKWAYSPGIDWAGRMVERVNGGMKLGEYMHRHLFHPLGIKNITFHLEESDHMRERLAALWQRTNEGELRLDDEPFIVDPIPDDFGGGGLYASLPELMTFLTAIARKDERILKESTLEMMFSPQLLILTGLDDLGNMPPFYRNSILNSIPDGTSINFGLGGLLNTEGVSGRRGSPSLTWSGYPNCYWWVDLENGVTGVYLSQLLPTGDSRSVQLLAEFEEAVYSSLR